MKGTIMKPNQIPTIDQVNSMSEEELQLLNKKLARQLGWQLAAQAAGIVIGTAVGTYVGRKIAQKLLDA